jgi:alkylhydroperoxidase/carboxymuconolactone decarboxylase family protein YurZ
VSETTSESLVSVDDVRREALALLEGVADGAPLDASTRALIALSVRVVVSTLDMDSARTATNHALDVGATPAEVHEALVLVSGLGVHTLMEGSRRVLDVLRERGDASLTAPLDDRQNELWRRHVGNDPYWQEMEAEVPGFLDALLRLSPEAFEAFFAFCAVPWQTGALPAITKELIAMATDATPGHRYLPGMRLHLRGAVARGAGRTAVLETLGIAAAAPTHRGLR